MEKRKAGGLDLSCFLLIEEVGDSEHCRSTDDGRDHHKMLVDDAESCSWDTCAADLEEAAAAAADQFQISSQEVGSGGDHRCCGYDEIVVLMSWSCWFGSNHLPRRSCLCTYCNFSDVVAAAAEEEEEEGEEVCCSRRHGSSRQIMDKNMEDRRFWETCLDVGCP